MAEQINTNNITQPGGMSTDTTVQQQPKGTSRYNLNVVNSTNRGERATLSNEEGNEVRYNLPFGFIPIGKAFMGNGRTALLLVNEFETVSEIGIGYDDGRYETHVNDELSVNKLNFKITNQVDIVYSLRRGCEDTIYFTDFNSEPRVYNFSKSYNFKDENGLWDGLKFSLIKYPSEIPFFSRFELLNSGGSIEAGSVMVAVQLLDADFNPTEWIIDSKPIFVYNDLTNKNFYDINGSINSAEEAFNYPATSKSLKITTNNLDDTFTFYRLAFIEANSGLGTINRVKFSRALSIQQNIFTYTGLNFESEGTTEEILFFNERIHKARHIEQVDNTLILADTQGSQIDFCKLQKYASKIKADCVIQKVLVNNINDPRSPKNPTYLHGDMTLGGGSYMPGEIYSFGIMYVLDNGEITPSFHIPGKNSLVGNTHVFDPSSNTYPMSINNSSSSNYYLEENNCGSSSFWGLDSENRPLANTRVRHHRFPFRSDIGIPLVAEVPNSGTNVNSLYRQTITGTGTLAVPCTQEMIDAGECSTLVNAPSFVTTIFFTVDNVPYVQTITINPAEWIDSPSEVRVVGSSNYFSSNNIVITSIEEDGVAIAVDSVSPKGLTYVRTIENLNHSTEEKLYESYILGIKFSNVNFPSEEELGAKVVGYFIVRNERIEEEKTILDSVVITPSLINKKYISHGLLAPELLEQGFDKISQDTYGLIHPEHKFNQKEYDTFTSLKIEGYYHVRDRKKSNIRYEDVLDGSSYDSETDKGNSGKDEDGWSWQCIVRDNIVEYSRASSSYYIDFSNVDKISYLDALGYEDTKSGSTTIYNISADNKIGMMIMKNTNNNLAIPDLLPYGVFVRNLEDNYSNFRTSPYFKESLSMQTASKTEIYSGDVTITSMKYTNMVFWENRIAKRAKKTSALKIILGVVIAVIGAVLSIFTAGTSLYLVGLGIAIASAGVLYTSSGIKQAAANKAYQEEYDKGLRETALDDFVNSYYRRADGPSDDEIQWITDSITDLFFESSINMYLRVKVKDELPSFLASPGKIETGNSTIQDTWEFFGNYYVPSDPKHAISELEKHSVAKMLAFNAERGDNRAYLGIPFGELYKINPDYLVWNKQKAYFNLPVEYDCCSECKEEFRQRIHYSVQSFDEELTDNFRVFLPNNYKDISGSTGPINNLFVLNNDLFVHTRDALYKMPRSYQERVTDQIVSFIGTGSMFEIPPIKMVDDDTGNSAGTQHKWGGVKTPSGYVFVSENQGKVFLLNGQQLKPISELGMNNWFLNNISSNFEKEYFKYSGLEYPFKDNVSNPFGLGFIAVYDAKNKRVLITKKDYTLDTTVLVEPQAKLYVVGREIYAFFEFDDTVQMMENQGWEYLGIEIYNRQPSLKFGRLVGNSYVTTNILSTLISTMFKEKKSWTMSFDLEYDRWISFHSYMPDMYISTPNKLFSFIGTSTSIWEHNIEGKYQTYYDTLHPSVIEYVSNKDMINSRIYDYVKLYFEAHSYDEESKEFYFNKNIFFTKVMAYNLEQNTGELDIIPKNDLRDSNWLGNQIKRNTYDSIKAFYKEGYWNMNEFRNFRVNYDKPMFIKPSLAYNYNGYIDKVLNTGIIDRNKSWSELEPLRDKHLVVRLIFDTFANVKMLMSFSIENETQSFR